MMNTLIFCHVTWALPEEFLWRSSVPLESARAMEGVLSLERSSLDGGLKGFPAEHCSVAG